MLHDTVVIEGEVSLINQIDGDPDVCIGAGGGSQPTGTKSILLTEAGTLTEDVSAYASAEINAVKSATASGAVASFSDGAEDVPMDSCVVDIEPVQSGSGDPSPSNVRPISGWNEVKVTRAGKNLLGGLVTATDTQNGVTYTANSDGTFTVNGTNSAGSVSDYRLSGRGSYKLNLPVGNYKLSGGVQGLNGSGNTLYLTISGNGNRYVGNNGTADSSFSIAEGEYISSMFIRMASGATASNVVFKPMIRIASENDATYEPYTGTEYPISLGQTVYGGTLDVVTGVLTVTHKHIIMDGDTTGMKFTTKGSGSSNNYYFSLFDGYLFEMSNGWVPASDMLAHDMISSHFPDDGSNTPAFRAYIGNSGTTLQPRAVFGADSAVTTVELANQWLADQYENNTPFEFVYPLATPTTVQLTPTEVKTLLGSNSVWADSGDIAVGYKADVYLTEGGITPTGTKSISITSNGTTTEDVTNYASASITTNVPASAVDTGTKSISSNGTHDVVGYASASVNVPNSYSASDEGKVVSNGALVAQTSDTVTTNDTYDTTLINSLTVNVSGGGGITVNGMASRTEPVGDITITSTIKERAFGDCENITKVTINGETMLRGSAFTYCPRLITVDAPTITSFGSSQQFNGDSALVNVNLPNVTTLGNNAFQNCTSLTFLDFPKLTRLNYTRCLYGCSSLKTLILRYTDGVVPVNNDVFTNTPFGSGGSGGTVYVPQSLISSYQTATNWSTLYNNGTCTFVKIEGSIYE